MATRLYYSYVQSSLTFQNLYMVTQRDTCFWGWTGKALVREAPPPLCRGRGDRILPWAGQRKAQAVSCHCLRVAGHVGQAGDLAVGGQAWQALADSGSRALAFGNRAKEPQARPRGQGRQQRPRGLQLLPTEEEETVTARALAMHSATLVKTLGKHTLDRMSAQEGGQGWSPRPRCCLPWGLRQAQSRVIRLLDEHRPLHCAAETAPPTPLQPPSQSRAEGRAGAKCHPLDDIACEGSPSPARSHCWHPQAASASPPAH